MAALRGNRIPLHLVLIFLVLTIGILSAGRLYYSSQQKVIKDHIQSGLSAVADLKVAQIANWRKERLADGAFTSSSFLLSSVQQFLEHPAAPGLRSELLAWMTVLTEQNGYRSVSLVDTRGAILLTTHPGDSVGSSAQLLIAQALKTREAVLSDFHPPQGTIRYVHLHLIVPLTVTKGRKQVPLGAMFLRIDPRVFLYPLIGSWPTPSGTAETLLVRRDGDDVLFLNELRFRKNTALTLRLPLRLQALPAAMAARGQAGIAEGKDYRGTPVLAAIRAVPETPWFMVAKVDQEEVSAPLKESARHITLFSVMLVILAGAGVGYKWKEADMLYYRREHALEVENLNMQRQAEEALRKYAEEIEDLYNHAPCGYHSLDENGTFVRINNTELSWLGYTRDEMVGKMKFPDIMTPASQKAFAESFPAFKQRGWMKNLDFQIIRKDGTTMSVILNATAVKDAAGNFIRSRATVYDITERKQIEAERERLIGELQEALANVRTLSGMLPICASCKKIRDDQGYWNQVESYISRHSGVEFSHSLCPECKDKLYTDHLKKGD